jgi:ACR3 family arsenite efflux pump ArsB
MEALMGYRKYSFTMIVVLLFIYLKVFNVISEEVLKEVTIYLGLGFLASNVARAMIDAKSKKDMGAQNDAE